MANRNSSEHHTQISSKLTSKAKKKNKKPKKGKYVNDSRSTNICIMLNAVRRDALDRCGKVDEVEIRSNKKEEDYTAPRNSLNGKVIVHAIGIRAYILDGMEEHGRQHYAAVFLLVLLPISITFSHKAERSLTLGPPVESFSHPSKFQYKRPGTLHR